MLAEMASEMNVGVMIFTESHLREEIRDGEIEVENYEIFRVDRKEFRNGGIIAYVQINLNLGVKNLFSLSYSKIETLILRLDKINTILIAVYRPPDTALIDFLHVLMKIKEVLEINSGLQHTIILTGDFNMPNINWATGCINGGTIDLQNQAEALMNFAHEFYMEQCVHKPTRGVNILDLFFTNNEEMLLNIEVHPPTILSDHQFIVVSTSYDNQNLSPGPIAEEGIESLNFTDNQTNWAEIDSSIESIELTGWPFL